MKKTSKKAKVKEVKKEEVELKLPELKLPELTPGAVNVAFTSEELFSYAQLLNVMSQGLEQMALDAAKINDLKACDILTARSQLSAVLAGKLSSHYIMGESPSRDVH
jgi:hypothetical protein